MDSCELYKSVTVISYLNFNGRVCSFESTSPFPFRFLSLIMDFKSQNLFQIREDVQQTELPPKTLPSMPEAAEDESGSAETATSEYSRSSPPAEPPHTSSQDIIMARTAAVNNYVTQQSESVASGLRVDVSTIVFCMQFSVVLEIREPLHQV